MTTTPAPSPSELVGYLWHWSTGKIVCPRNFKTSEGTDLVFNSQRGDVCQFKFVKVKGAGHFGYIQHVKSKLVVLPATTDTLEATDNSGLIIQKHKHAGALFGFDEDGMFILHRSGKIWCAKGGNPNPTSEESVVLSLNRDDAAKFYFGDENKNPISPYPTPDHSGDWNLLRAFITPQADHTYNQTYKIGRSKTETDMSQHAWSVSAGFAMGLFSADGDYRGAVEETSSETWSEEKEESYTISVTGDKSVFVWQYTFTISQFGEEVKFLSSIIGDTNDVNVKPKIKAAAKKSTKN